MKTKRMLNMVLACATLLLCAAAAQADDLYTVANAKGDINPPTDFFYPGYRLVDFDHDINGNLLPFDPETINPLDPNLYSAWGVTFSTASTLYIATSSLAPESAVDYAQNSSPNSLFSWTSYAGPNGPNYALFSGDQFPTAVGMVFTDGWKYGGNPFYVQVYDRDGSLIPGSKVSFDYSDDTWYTSFGEDAFVGIAYRDGISKLEWGTQYGSAGGLEVDNLMFGQGPVVPEPTTMALFAFGLAGLAARMRKKRS